MFDYLRSVKPVARANTPHRLRWPYSTQAALAVWRAMYFSPAAHTEDAAQSPEWNRGAYLVRGLGHCSACHTTRNALGASSDMMDLSGGLIPMQNWYAPSLASPGEAGLHDWEPAQIVRLLQAGVADRGTVLGPMAEVVLQSTQHLSPADLRAMAVFLKALPRNDGRSVRRSALQARGWPSEAPSSTISTAPNATATKEKACQARTRRSQATGP